MYRAKERGGARTELFDTAMRDRAVEALAIEQESFSARSSRASCVCNTSCGGPLQRDHGGDEALVRWQHP